MRFIRPMALGGDVEYIYIRMYTCISVYCMYIYIMNLSIVKCCL